MHKARLPSFLHRSFEAVHKEREEAMMSVMATRTSGAKRGTRSATATHRRFAAILDLENVAITNEGRVSQSDMAALLDSIESLVTGMPVRVATGAHIMRAYMDQIGLQGWGLTLVRTEPDAADDALCEAAHDFIRSGVTDLIVVSGDHAFVPLASHLRLHVICHADHLSRALRLAATTVTYLPQVRPAALTAS